MTDVSMETTDSVTDTGHVSTKPVMGLPHTTATSDQPGPPSASKGGETAPPPSKQSGSAESEAADGDEKDDNPELARY